MAFDRTDPADVSALKTELTTDPISINYNLNGSASRLVFLINDGESNTGGETAERPFTAMSLMDALDPADYESPQAGTKAAEYTHMLLELAAYESIETYKSKWRAQFAGNSATVIALDAQSRRLSRAEVLFGNGTVISENDINTALSS